MKKADFFYQTKQTAIYSFLAIFTLTTAFLLVVLLKNIDVFHQVRQDKQTLIEKIKSLEKERSLLKEDIAGLNSELENLEKKASRTDAEAKKIKQELDHLRFISGLTRVRGDGVEIILKDAEVAGSLSQKEEAVVHDSDLRLLVNGLFLGGAEAVSINGERLISISSIRCVGPTILINSRRVSSPFVIRAIGDPDKLVNGIYSEPSLNYYLTELFPQIGIGFSVKKVRGIEIPPYRGSLSLDFEKVKVVKR